MVKLNEFLDKGKKELVIKLISEDVTKEWVRNVLLQKKFRVSHHSRDLSLAEFFDRYIWDNLTEEQQKKIVESLNLIIEEDLFLEKEPDYGYWSDLLDFAILLDQKYPRKISSKPFLIWKEKNYPNLLNSSERVHPEFIKKLNTKIESAFLKKKEN